MKKIALIASIISAISCGAFAQDATTQKNDFASHKGEIIANMNKEKAIIDTAISCINSATKREDAEKCHAQKKASMDALRAQMEASREQRMEQRKENLQNKINKMNEKSAAKSGAASTSAKQ